MLQRKQLIGILTGTAAVAVVVVGIVFYKQYASITQGDQSSRELALQTQAADIIKTGDLTQCATINDPVYSAVCVNNIALALARKQNDISYCAKLDDKLVSRADCEQQVVLQKSIQEANIAVCKESTFPNVVKICEGSFYYTLALVKNDSNICYQDPNKSMQDLCHDRVVLFGSSNNPDFQKITCNNLKSPLALADCTAFRRLLSPQTTPGDVALFCKSRKTDLFQKVCLTVGGMPPP